MCGICGTTRGDLDAVHAMNAAMHHRGPDDEGIHCDPCGGMMLGARRLSIIDPAGGHQPLSNEDGTVWGALNGEIYNHPSLLHLLRDRGHQLATRSDTEVLVHLYEEYGDGLVHALEGMYALAVWDRRRQRLLLARDRFGEKPLFYAHDGGTLTFASELTALCAGTRHGWDLDPAAVEHLVMVGYVAGPSTILQGPRQLPPGHMLTWERASRRVEVTRYWSPPPVAGGGRVDADQLASEVSDHLHAAVRSRMIADVPVGVFLSGGIDSTLVAALAARQSAAGLRTFTVGYDTGTVDEREPARRSARAIGAEHHELVLTAEDVARRAPQLFATIDQPLADQSLVAAHALAECARHHVKVVVGGEGADELFAGYPRYLWLARASQLHRVVPARLSAAAERTLGRLPDGRRQRRLRALLAPGSTGERQLTWVTDGRRELRPHVYGRRLRGATDGLAILGGAGDAAEDGASAVIRADQLGWLPDDVLAKADRASMLVSLEVRTPYLSRSLTELAVSLPLRCHAHRQGKLLLRRVLEEVLPGAGAGRRKVAFRVPSAEWLRGPLLPVLQRQVRRGALYDEGWFDRAAVSRLVDQHAAMQHDWTGILWPLLVLGCWLDRFRGVDDAG
jgi:asparagine synthase (glutamine-hydrolysing)